MPDIFSRIIAGEIPCFKIWEDEFTFAFLDINPINPGHTLVVPKVEIDYFADVPDPYYSAVFKTARKLASALTEITGAARIGMLVAGFDVPHFHLHLVPISHISELNFDRAKSANRQELSQIHQKITDALLNESIS